MTIHPEHRNTTGDNALDLVASMLELAFEDAETSTLARSELIYLLNPETLHRLYLMRLISWDPSTVIELPYQHPLLEVD